MSKVLAPALVAASTNGEIPHPDYAIVFAYLGVILLVAQRLRRVVSEEPSRRLRARRAGLPPARASPAPAPPTMRRHVGSGVGVLGAVRHDVARVLLQYRRRHRDHQLPVAADAGPVEEASTRSLPKEALAAYGATLIAVSSLFNGVGRFFWGGVSDRIGRVQTFRLMLATQIVGVRGADLYVGNPWLFGALICYDPPLLRRRLRHDAVICARRIRPAPHADRLRRDPDRLVSRGHRRAADLRRHQGPPPARKASTWSFIVAGCFLAVGLATSLLGLSNAPFRRKAPWR